LTLVALGDSITRGRGMVPAYGADPRSWAEWLAEAMGLPFLNLAVDGAVASDVVRSQLSRVPPCEVATLYVGANDARGVAFDAEVFGDAVGRVVAALGELASRVVVLTVPRDLGRPLAGAVEPANSLLRAAAAGHTVVSLEDFGGWRHVLPDAVHPTALGQVEIADRVARALGVTPLPSEVAEVRRTLANDLRFAPFYARQLAKDHWRRHRESRNRPPRTIS
jgi:lysophospholipase L1-like esterase